MAAIRGVLAGFQSVSAIVDCIKICYEGYRHILIFIRTFKEMRQDVAQLQQRFKEEECGMWTFALARNLVVAKDHPVDALPKSLPQFWVEVVDTRFVLIKKHLEEAEQLVCRYIEKVPISGTKPTQEPEPLRRCQRSSELYSGETTNRITKCFGCTDSFQNHIKILQDSSIRTKLR